MNVTLTPALAEMVQEKLASGRYTSVSEVIREALLVLDARDHLHEAKLDQLRRDIQDGLDSGPATPWDPEEAKRQGRKKRADETDQGRT